MNQVFEQFVKTLKANPLAGEDVALRIQEIIDAGVPINQRILEGALFPREKAKGDVKT